MLNDGKRMMMIRGSFAGAFLLGFYCQVTAGETATKAESTTTIESRPSVVVTTVTTRDVSRRQIYVGRVQAINTVQLTARVEGFLEQRDFAEGSYVKKGQTLFLIEQAAYKAAVEQSEADVEGNQAQQKNDQIEYERNKKLAETNDVTQATLDSSIATLDTAKANVKKANAALATSKLNLSYTEVRSPIDGRISAANVDVGNLVGPSTGTLATVVSMDPIYVTFYVAERDLIEARNAGFVKGTKVALTPYLQLADGSTYAHPGKLDYLGIQVEQTTDTIEVRAVFPNPEHVLIPGQFVNVTVKTDKKKTALVVPQVALQQDQGGYYVLVVGKNDKVQKRSVKLGQQVDSDWVVTEGLTKGERVIVGGIQKVTPGLLVNAVDQKA
jgi:membrane fusion protein (multidrug efflux system)